MKNLNLYIFILSLEYQSLNKKRESELKTKSVTISTIRTKLDENLLFNILWK